jgi:hypothetical protein
VSTTDHLLAQCGQLRAAWGWLAEAVIPGRSRRNQRALTESATAKRDQQAQAERNDRAKLLAAGKLLAGNSSSPANLSAVDARDKIANKVDDAAWQLASHLRGRVQPPYRAGQPAYRPDGRSADHRFKAAVDWVSLNAARLTPDDQAAINHTYRELVDATTLATSTAGCGPDRRPLAAECPACGRRALRWDCSSSEPVEWHILCTNPRCRCAGRDCPCKLPERQPGMTHLWLEAGWERFAEQLTAKETA